MCREPKDNQIITVVGKASTTIRVVKVENYAPKAKLGKSGSNNYTGKTTLGRGYQDSARDFSRLHKKLDGYFSLTMKQNICQAERNLCT